jgi:hypothetical protein
MKRLWQLVPNNPLWRSQARTQRQLSNRDFRRLRKIAKRENSLRNMCPSVRPSVCMEQLCSHWTDVYEILYLSIFFENLSGNFKFRSNWTRITGTLYEDRHTFLISRSILFRMRNVSDKSYRANQKTHFMFNNFFRKLCRLWDNEKKGCRTWQAIGDNMNPTHCILDTKGYKHTLRLRKIYCLPTTIKFAHERA